jgi:two-component system sensor histidine kinase RegB
MDRVTAHDTMRLAMDSSRWQAWVSRARADTDAAGNANMRQLVTLRWIAVAGQLVTVLTVRFLLGIDLPLVPMLLAMAASVALNLASMRLYGWQRGANAQLLLAMLLDVGLLTVQLYLSGGATNPFIALYLLQVVLGAVLLDRWSSWAIVGVTGGCFALLTIRYRRLPCRPIMRASISRSTRSGRCSISCSSRRCWYCS